MKDRNYDLAERQIADKMREVADLFHKTADALAARQPADALEFLTAARTAIDGAMTSAKWATTLPAAEGGG